MSAACARVRHTDAPAPTRAAHHVHACPRHRSLYVCGKVTARCLLPFKTVAECPREAEDEARLVERGRRYWSPPQPRAGG